MERHAICSRAMRSAGYDPATSSLELEFSAGSVYRYFAVPEYIFDALANAMSRGAFFQQQIRDVYPYERVE